MHHVTSRKNICILLLAMASAGLLWSIHWTSPAPHYSPVLPLNVNAKLLDLEWFNIDGKGKKMDAAKDLHRDNGGQDGKITAKDGQDNTKAKNVKKEEKKTPQKDAIVQGKADHLEDSNNRNWGELENRQNNAQKTSQMKVGGKENVSIKKIEKKKDNPKEEARRGGNEKQKGAMSDKEEKVKVKNREKEGKSEEKEPEQATESESYTLEPEEELPRVLEQYRIGDAKSAGPFTAVNITAYAKWIFEENDDCRWVVRLPKELWKCQNHTSLFTAEEDYDRMCHIISCGGPLDPDYMKTPPRQEGLYPFEKFYLSHSPLHDPLLAANETTSVVTFLNKSTTFTIGDSIALRIDLKDGYGRGKVKGGDVIRAWIKGKRWSGATVLRLRDFDNGTYMASGRLMWAGHPRVKVALVYPREYLRALVHLQLVMKSLKLSAGAFNNSEANEATPCSHLPLVPGHDQKQICNLTQMNGSPWFCGRPIKSELNCSDFLGSRNLPMPWKDHPFLPVTSAEQELLDRSNVEPRIRHIMTPRKIKIQEDAKSTRLLQSSVPCNTVTANETWHQATPTGFFYDDIWRPAMCRYKAPTVDCFKNLRLVILGDSNCRSHHQYACELTKSRHIQEALYKAWHAPLSCVNKKLNFSSLWYPHGNPFMSSNWVWAQYGSLIPTPHAIDEIPSTGRTLLVLHHYLHLTPGHMTSTEVMHRAVKAAVVRLINRNPEAKVIIRGPHIAYEGWANHYAGGDMFGPYIENLVSEIYGDVQDRVFYFSPWDMSVATENIEFHPDVQRMVADVMVSIMCGR